jgi:hypothetical protein
MAVFQPGHAVLIGVGGSDIPNTVDDAAGLAAILVDPDRCAYPPALVQLLTSADARRTGILAALDQVAKTADAQSTVVIYFSGHGYRVTASIGEAYYLIPHGYDLGQLHKTAICGQEFADKLAAIPAQRLLVLLDCCHAGGIGEAKAPGLAFAKAPLPADAPELLAQGSGRVVIASSRADELSYAGKPLSAFTLVLVEALCGEGAARPDGYVRVADLALHARQVVPGRTQDRQHPILHFEHADNFLVAYYAAGDAKPKGLPFGVAPQIEPEPGAWAGQGSNVVYGDQIITTGPVATHGSAISTGGGTAFVGNSNVVITGKVNGDMNVDKTRRVMDK